MNTKAQYEEAVEKAACGWLVLVAYHHGSDEQLIDDCQAVAALLATKPVDGKLLKPQKVYEDIFEAYKKLPKPHILELLTFADVPSTLH